MNLTIFYTFMFLATKNLQKKFNLFLNFHFDNILLEKKVGCKIYCKEGGGASYEV
jgi:hypothetical protein